MSNPDSPQAYWQESARGRQRGGRAAASREDRYGREADDGRQDADNYGRAASGRSNAGRANGYGRGGGNGSSGGYRQDNGYQRGNTYDGNGYDRGGYDRDGYDRGGYDRDGGYGRDNGYQRGNGNGHRRSDSGRSQPGEDAAYDRGRSGRAARGRNTQIGSDLRSRLGLDNGGSRGYRDDGYQDDDYDGDGEARGYRRGYRDTGGWRAATTGVRERLTSRFSDTSTRGGRRARGYAGGGSGDGRGGRTRVRRKGDWWRHWTWKKAFLVALGTGAGLVVLIILGIVFSYESTSIPTDVSALALQQSSTVYFANGKTEVGTFTANGIDRQLLASNQIPAVMKNAIVAAEDRNFYHEGGISTTGILRAAYTDVRGGDYAQGGSTITQEFVRNYFTSIGTEKTLSRKLDEVFVSIKLSHEKSKDWILTQYLNIVPFGDNAYGVAAAAQTYFGEPAMKLTVSQAAMLAALPNQPSTLSADPSAGAGYTALVNRWHYVLTNMVRDGVITQAEASAQKFPTVENNNVIASGYTGYKGYIMDAVRNELHETYGYTFQQIDSDGLKIVTTFNANLMNGLYSTVGYEEQQMRANGTALPWYAHVGAVLEQPGTGDIVAMYGGPGEDLSASQCTKLLCYDNTATKDREQVGSSFKPYVLATAVHENMDVQNSVLDAIQPMCVPPDSQPMTMSTVSTNCPAGWYPVNIQGENGGAMTVANAAAVSSDPAFEDLEHRAGTQATINMAKEFGVNVDPASQGGSGLQSYVGQVGMALGIASLTVEEQATTFATLANDGEYVTPHVIAQLTTSDGSAVPLKITHREVLTPAQAADVDYALSFDTQNGGTASPNGVLNPFRPTIGKTGTTDQAESAFFEGAIPQYSLAVGMFTNEQDSKLPSQCGSAGVNSPKPCGQTLNVLPSVNAQAGGFGGAWPTTIWQNFMQNQFGNLPVEQLSQQDYTGFTKWDQVQQTSKPTQPKKSKNPGQNQCAPGQVRMFGQCVGPSQSPSPSSPSSPSPPFSPPPTTPPPFPGGGGGGGGHGGGKSGSG